MAFEFKSVTDGGYFDWGSDPLLTQDGNITLTLWAQVRALGLTAHDDVLINVANPFFGQDPLRCTVLTNHDTGGFGWGLRCFHVGGGGFFKGVECIPGKIDARYTWSLGQWLFFAFTRNALVNTWSSFFGSRTALIDGQQNTYDANTGAVGALPLYVGNGTHDELVGPFSYWKRILKRDEIVMVSQCQIPADPTRDLLLFSRMNTNPPTDISTYVQPVHVHGAPGFLADPGCAQYAQGLDYSLTSTGG